MAVQKQDEQHEHTFSSYVRIRDVVLKTYLGRWTIRRSGERGSGISVLPARHDDDDIYIYIYTCVCVCVCVCVFTLCVCVCVCVCVFTCFDRRWLFYFFTLLSEIPWWIFQLRMFVNLFSFCFRLHIKSPSPLAKYRTYHTHTHTHTHRDTHTYIYIYI